MDTTRVTIGGDPEFFLWDPGAKRPVPAHTHFKSKEELLKDRPGYHIGAFRDGYAVEFNPRASYCREQLASSFHTLVRDAVATLGPIELLPASAVEVDHSQAAEWPPDVRRAGCSPSFSAYGPPPKVPKDLTKLPFRAAGGHFHVSWTTDRFVSRSASWGYVSVPETIPHSKMVRFFDAFAGVAFTYIFQDRPEIFRRREIYGLAGEYRDNGKQYIEYRVLGPEAWSRVPFISLFSGILRSVVMGREKLVQKWDTDWDAPIREAINNGRGLAAVAKGLTVPHFFDIDVLERLRDYARYCRKRFPFLPRSCVSSRYGFQGLVGSIRNFPARPQKEWKVFDHAVA
jgi:hypothetical protein